MPPRQRCLTTINPRINQYLNIVDMKVPEGYERARVQERMWYRPWQQGSKVKDREEDQDPILTMAGPSPNGSNPDFTEGDSGDSLLGYRWDTKGISLA